jgi:hypothetical protein
VPPRSGRLRGRRPEKKLTRDLGWSIAPVRLVMILSDVGMYVYRSWAAGRGEVGNPRGASVLKSGPLGFGGKTFLGLGFGGEGLAMGRRGEEDSL